MSEIIPSNRLLSTHNPGHESFFLDSYRLLCHFLASPHIAQIENELGGRKFRGFYEKQEISRLLINIASRFRVKSDDGEWCDSVVASSQIPNVGELRKDVSGAEDLVPLELREACNKIIHAKKVHFDCDSNGNSDGLNPILYLYGNKGAKEWKATLNIVKFCTAALNVVV